MKGNDSIRSRWLKRYLTAVILLLFIVQAILIVVVNNYYTAGIKANLTSRAGVTASFFSKYIITDTNDLYNSAKTLVYEFVGKEQMEMQFIDVSGNVLLSSNGITPAYKIETQDYQNALKGNTTIYQGRNARTDERIMSASAPIIDSSGQLYGVVRYVTSMENAMKNVLIVFGISVAIIMIIMIFLISSGVYFLHSIINPVGHITQSAKEVARGNLNVEIKKENEDEIGELADTLNFMIQELKKSDDIKNEFISSVSHELRTPLTSIKGWSETALATDMKDKEQLQKCLSIIASESQRLGNMVEELLDFSRILRDQVMLNLQPADIEKEIEDVLFMLMDKIKAKGIIISYNPMCGDPDIMIDEAKIRQVIINILDNAIKFSREEGTIKITTQNQDGFAVVQIEDQGEGIKEEELEHVKDKFFKGSSQHHGNGIGLAIADEMIRAHHGMLEIDSVYGEGTQITIRLPEGTEPAAEEPAQEME
ncbi:MAG: HAMP domain-containing protein [Clostridia bacterium]|nr:HAMP domain-containing protein [Clostridia bacterium]